MPEFVYLLLAGIIAMCGDSSLPQPVEQPCKQVVGGAAENSRLEQSEDSSADLRDGELVGRMLHRKRLSKEESVELEAAALRRLERRKAELAERQRLSGGGSGELQALDALRGAVDTALKDYVQAVSRTALFPDG